MMELVNPRLPVQTLLTALIILIIKMLWLIRPEIHNI